MPKRRYITSSNIIKMQKQGRGLGQREAYKPWITVRDVSSKGFVHRIKGWKTKRVHHLLSNLELSLFYTLEWAFNVVDIREKYPLLPLDRTMEIAKRFGINHPMDRNKNEAIVMTTDFLVDIQFEQATKLIAYSIMPSNRRNLKRVLQKIFLERTFWKEQGIDFLVVTEKDINENLVQNMEWLHDAKELTLSPGISIEKIYHIESVLFNKIKTSKLPLAKVCKEMDKDFDLESGVSLWVARHLIANRLWIVDMSKKIITTKYVPIDRSNKLISMLRKEYSIYDFGS
ncbi:TPA: TnsA endonuclease C-terminal domain-containing protein [Bacillus paranthracis]